MTRFALCRCCGDDHPADLIVSGECYLCRNALDSEIDAATTAELCALIDAERAAFYADAGAEAVAL